MTVEVNGAWYLDSLPMNLVLEFEDGSLLMAPITPMEPVEKNVEKKLTPYQGRHPRRCKGQPLPSYLYRFYGLEKSDETANETIHVRLTPSEKEKLQVLAGADDMTISEFVRTWIRTLDHKEDSQVLYTIKTDFEYNAEDWWEAAKGSDNAPAPIKPLLDDCDEVITVTEPELQEILAWAKALPGWDDGPAFARHPLLINEEDE